MEQEPVIEKPEIEPRDTVWMRWAKFVSIVVVLAVLVGGLFGISIHVVALLAEAKFMTSDPYRHQMGGAAEHQVEQSKKDTSHAFKVRFIIGSGIGGVVGLIYVIRCLAKNEDP